jgi:site-specific DNA-methyltransferase (adenine-specific)
MTKPYYETELGKLYHGDCLEIMPKLEPVDLVLTDPPYSKEFNWVWAFLNKHSPKTIKENGHLVSLLGHNQVPIAISELSKTMTYWWICGLENKRSNKLFGKNVIIKFKPAIWFLKGKRKRENNGYFPFDFISAKNIEFKAAKEWHEWGQPETFFNNFIENLTVSYSEILDPFFGSGTTAIACERLNRRWIGIFTEEQNGRRNKSDHENADPGDRRDRDRQHDQPGLN